MTSSDPVRPLHLRRHAVREGWSDDELGRLVRSGELARLRRGAYVDGLLPADPADRHRLLVHATLPVLRRSAVVSHRSAAVLHGLPLWDVALDRVHVTRRPPAWQDTSAVLRCHVPGCATTRSSRSTGWRSPHPPGRRSTWRAPCPTRLRSSPSTRRCGSAPSALQHEVRDPAGLLVARTDFAWEEHGLLGEFDGRVEYGRLLRPGQDPGGAVFAEKRREDAIRDEGWRVVRWVWSELGAGHRVAARVRRARDRSRR